MNIKLELFGGAVAEAINGMIRHIEVDMNEVADSVAVSVLREIKAVIQDDELEDDFDVVEKIVRIFETYNIDAGNRHDFG